MYLLNFLYLFFRRSTARFVDVHQLTVLLEVTLLAEAFVAVIALEFFHTGVKSDMIFDVARFVEGLATAVYQTLQT
tara:strand:- start:595 stop:822 length:228 start_codon:yes stop_codon:yes gene_type:complete